MMSKMRTTKYAFQVPENVNDLFAGVSSMLQDYVEDELKLDWEFTHPQLFGSGDNKIVDGRVSGLGKTIWFRWTYRVKNFGVIEFYPSTRDSSSHCVSTIANIPTVVQFLLEQFRGTGYFGRVAVTDHLGIHGFVKIK